MKTRRFSLLSALLCLFVLFATSHSVAGQTTYPPSETITYRDLDGTTLTLRAFNGRHIRYAFPDSWLEGGGGQGLTPSELVTLIERTDLLYEKIADVTGGEPRGDSLMTIAIVPLGSDAGGTALLGIKTCEISSNQLAVTKVALAQGTLSEVILHEVAHTFDLYRNYLGYYPDSPHNWTDFWIAYSQYLLRFGDYQLTPDLALQEKIYRFTSRWDQKASSNSWAQCVKSGGGCETEGITANKAYAGLLLRYARLHGVEAVKRAFEFYKSYKASHDPNDVFNFTPEQKNDLLVEALAYGANANVTGELDAWFWPLSDAMRDKLRQTYPAQNPNVVDADGHKNPVVGKRVEANDPAHQLIITQQGDTLLVEETNTKISGLNSKSPATYKDGVLRLESGFGRPAFFYDAKTDRLSGQSMIGKIEFKRQ